MRCEDVRQAFVALGRLVRAAAAQFNALGSEACLPGSPIDSPGGQLLLHRFEAELVAAFRAPRRLIIGTTAKPTCRTGEIAVAIVGTPPLSDNLRLAPGLAPAHHAPSTMDGGIERLRAFWMIDALHDYRVFAH